MTLYNLVTGRLPFEADNIYLLFQTIGKGVYTVPNDVEQNLTALIHGLLHINNRLRFTIEQIKQHEWFRRRPPRTFEVIPFPNLALNRFQTCTMFEYLNDLHQPAMDIETNTEEERMKISDPIITHLNESNDNQSNEQPQEPNGQLAPNCSQVQNGQTVNQTKTRSKREPRICSLS